jgi:ferredoxin, 2Fe-2S
VPKVTFVDPTGIPKVVNAETGYSLMEVATRNGVEGITAECGGACACATCHVYIESEWVSRLPPADANELALVEFADHLQPQSRLSCQIKIEEALDGLIVRIPPH